MGTGLASDTPGEVADLITPSDSVELPPMRGVHVGATAGVIVGRLRRDSVDRTLPVLANTFYPYDMRLVKVASTATTLHAVR